MSRSLLVFLVGLILVGFGFYLYSTDQISLVSPIPKVFGASKQVSLPENTWFPKEIPIKKPYDLNLSANSAILVNYDTNEIIFSKNMHGRQPVASTVKIMTALLALEANKLNDLYLVPESATKIGEDSMLLKTAEKLTMRDILYGLMLVSGNDAAATIGQNVSGNQDKFVNLMNDRAKQLGAKDTKYINPSGLDEDGKTQYSSAYDLAIIAHYLWENYPAIRDISSTYHYLIPASSDHQDYELYNGTNLLTTYPGVRGIKPGFTWDAGWCLVTYVENNGKRFIGVVLGSQDRRGEMKEVLDYGYAYYGIKISHPGLDLQAPI
ncbi:D-alanyl-D-alanine carboxypeptidase [Candidatus Curtissbacteria bacterium]|nr:D-alanyl-D-alanine carboxypeptidase [Candidatus Curtissbacteria bacterium]